MAGWFHANFMETKCNMGYVIIAGPLTQSYITILIKLHEQRVLQKSQHATKEQKK